MTTNYLTLYEGLKIFRDGMLPFIVEKLQAAYDDRWWEQGVARCFRGEEIERLRVLFEKRHDSLVVERPGDELAEMLDINWFGNIIEGNWKQAFRDAFGDRKVVGWLQEVREIRNAVAHPQRETCAPMTSGAAWITSSASCVWPTPPLPPRSDSSSRGAAGEACAATAGHAGRAAVPAAGGPHAGALGGLAELLQ